MKKIFLSALAVCAIFAGCNKENGVLTQGDNVLVVKLPANVITRAVEAQVADQATAATVSNAEVFLINANTGAVVERHTFVESVAGSNSMRIEQVAASVNKVVMIANIPSDELSTVQALDTYNAVKGYAFTVASQNLGAGGIEDKTLMGEAVPAVAADPDASHTADHAYKEVTINLDALTARFEIGDVTPGTGIESVELVGVWINNFYADGSKAAVTFNNDASAYWDITPASSTTPSATAFGLSDFTVPTYVPAAYYNAYDSEVLLDAASKVYAFHVFAGENIPHVIMLVKGELKTGYYADDNKYFFGWLTFRGFLDNGTAISSIDANTIYKIGVGTTGVKVDAKDITEKPEQEKFDLGIECLITPWTAKTVTPSVN